MKNYLVYQITNKLNKNIYIGSHVTENIKDDYMGSGTNIMKAIDKFGIKNFEKIVLYNFDNKQEMVDKETELVNKEFISRNDTYNIIIGGGWNTAGNTIVKNKDGNKFMVNVNDPRFLSGEFVGHTSGKVNVRDKNGNTMQVDKNDSRYLSGEFFGSTKNLIPVKNNKNKKFLVDKNDPRYLSGELVHVAKGTITVKDKDNNTLRVNLNDPRYLSGELVVIWEGKRHSEKTKAKMSATHQKNGNSKGKKNSQFGKCWIYNNNEKISKRIQKEELSNWMEKGWEKGRKMNFNEQHGIVV